VDAQKSPARRIAFPAALAVLALALVPVALAAKGGNGGGGNASTGSLALVMVSSSSAAVADSASSGPHWGDTIKFEGTTNATTQPNVELVCSQNGTVVYAGLSGWYETAYADGAFTTRNLTLKSQAWTGGAANCTATLYYISGLRIVKVATLPVSVSG
jgi:hypothetical protein